MRIRIPLPYYSKAAYDICSDDFRGGWLWFGFGITCERTRWPNGVRIHVTFGRFWRFSDREYVYRGVS